MPAILTENFSVLNTENFMTSVGVEDTISNLYITIGRGYNSAVNNKFSDWLPYTDYETFGGTKDDYLKWEDDSDSEINDTTPNKPQNSLQGVCDESNPPLPKDKERYKVDFRNHITYMKLLGINDLTMMVPRYNYNQGSTYYPINPRTDQGKRAKNYYVVSNDLKNSRLEVWQCITNPTGTYDTNGDWTGGNPSTDQPTLAKWQTTTDYDTTSTSTKIYKAADGYVWKFLYDISTIMQTTGKVLTNWIPVPFGKFGLQANGNLTDYQCSVGDPNANRTLGAHRILVTTTLGEDDNLPYDSIYRQIGILADPRTNANEKIHDESIAVNENINLMSGELIYMENRNPIVRTEGQMETLQLLLVF